MFVPDCHSPASPSRGRGAHGTLLSVHRRASMLGLGWALPSRTGKAAHPPPPGWSPHPSPGGSRRNSFPRSRCERDFIGPILWGRPALTRLVRPSLHLDGLRAAWRETLLQQHRLFHSVQPNSQTAAPSQPRLHTREGSGWHRARSLGTCLHAWLWPDLHAFRGLKLVCPPASGCLPREAELRATAPPAET